MQIDLRNDHLQVRIATKGAQLMSIRGADGTEYLWQGDPNYWCDRSPTIFPYVARLTGGNYTYQGKTYSMPIHGFAPTAEFSLLHQQSDSATFLLEDNEEFYAMYPFRFRFLIRYYLQENILHVEETVENRGDEPMYFALGGHPGINIPLEKGLRFEEYYLHFPECRPRRVEFTPDCFITGREHPFPLQENKLPLRHDLFDDDAIVLKGVPGSVTVRSDAGTHGVTLLAPDQPIYGFWHMPRTDAPYLCMEPWSSLPSRTNVVEDLEQQPDLLHVEGGGTYVTTWSLQCF